MKSLLFFLLVTLISTSFGGPRFRTGTVLSAIFEDGEKYGFPDAPRGMHCLVITVELDHGRSLGIRDYALSVIGSETEYPCAELRVPGTDQSLQLLPADPWAKTKAVMLFFVPEKARKGRLIFKLFGTGWNMKEFPFEEKRAGRIHP